MRMTQIGSGHGHAMGKWAALQANPDVEAVRLCENDQASEVLQDPSIVAVAIESRNHESLPVANAAIDAGKHLWFDKPAGDDWPQFARLMDQAQARGLYVQMGYMFRYSPAFSTVATWVHSGVLGRVFGVRAHMSTHVNLVERTAQSRHRGGILYDLGGHMIDHIVWLLGRPVRVSSVLRNDATPELPAYSDNTLAILEFDAALASIEIAAMEVPPTARRFEVFGSRGTAIVEPFDSVSSVRLRLAEAAGEFSAGEHVVDVPLLSRQQLYEQELAAFVRVLRGEQPPDRPASHELLVQETLLRATGRI